MISYSRFIEILSHHISNSDDFLDDLLKTVITNPNRYCGIFRLSDAKTKLIQNVTQSKEIKFGDFMEDIITEYLGLAGYQNMPKNIGKNKEGDELNVDQLFVLGKTLFLIEQKIRDDHDSTKKRGQFDNFEKKVRLVRTQYPEFHIDASMWFIDNSLVKNKKYYIDCIKNLSVPNSTIGVFYGETLFNHLNHPEIWIDLVSNLKQLHNSNNHSSVIIPDFDTSPEILSALIHLDKKLWNKLPENKKIIQKLRQFIR